MRGGGRCAQESVRLNQLTANQPVKLAPSRILVGHREWLARPGHFFPRNGINPKCRTNQTGTAKMAIAANRFQVHSSACA